METQVTGYLGQRRLFHQIKLNLLKMQFHMTIHFGAAVALKDIVHIQYLFSCISDTVDAGTSGATASHSPARVVK